MAALHSNRGAVVVAALLFVACVGAKPSPYQIGDRKVTAQAAWRTTSGAKRGKIPIGYLGAASRQGEYYLPAGYYGRPLPMLVMLHGSGMKGADMIWHFQAFADKYKFIIVAPDSRDTRYWFAASAKRPLTSDWVHVHAAVSYVRQQPGVKVNPNKVAYGGFSRGGYSAAALASRTISATHAIVIHSSITPGQLGRHRVPIWVSTGNEDPLFAPRLMRRRVSNLRWRPPHFPIHFQVFTRKGGCRHTLNCPGEKESAIRWWMKRGKIGTYKG